MSHRTSAEETGEILGFARSANVANIKITVSLPEIENELHHVLALAYLAR